VTAGCGSGKGDSAQRETTPRSAKEEFRVSGNRICEEAVTQALKLPPSGTLRDAVEFVEWTRAVQDIMADGSSRLRSLTPPRGDEAKIDSILDKFDRVRMNYVEMEAAARARSAKAWTTMWDANVDVAREAQYESAVYGLDKCAHYGWAWQ